MKEEIKAEASKQKESNETITIIEKNVHRTNAQRIKDTLCLFFPIAAAFAGCFLTEPVLHFFAPEKKAPELLKFGAAIVLFLITSGIIFIKTRKINPIMKIGIFSGKDDPSQEN